MIRVHTSCDTPLKCSEPMLSKNSGIGLIEVVVALLVLAIGFLLSGNMQLKGLREHRLSSQYSQAVMIADDIMDRMLNNREGVEAGFYDGIRTGAVTRPGCADTGCDASELAQLDLFEWSSHLVNVSGRNDFIPALPVSENGTSATASVSNPDVDGVYTISVDWTRQDDNEVNETLSVKFTQ